MHSPPSEQRQRLVHRLIHKAIPSSSPSDNAGELLQRKIIAFEILLAQPKQAAEDVDAPDSLTIEPRCEQGTESQLNLMMPDR